MKVDWKGVYPAACTQFHADQSLNIPGTLEHLEAMIQAGVHGMVMLGTVGENCSLRYEEKIKSEKDYALIERENLISKYEKEILECKNHYENETES